MKAQFLLRSFVGLLAAVFWPGQASANEATFWLEQMSSAFATRNYEIGFVYIHDDVVESMRLLHSVEDGIERERLIHLDGPPREVVRNADGVIYLIAGMEPVKLDKYPNTPFSQVLSKDWAQMANQYHFLLKERDRIAGREAQVVHLISKDEHRYHYRLWLDVASGLLLRSDLVSDKEHTVEQILVVSLLETPHFADAAFEISRPLVKDDSKGEPMQTIRDQSQAKTADSKPRNWQVNWMPEGFKLQRENSSLNVDGEMVDHLMFSDGVASISVYVQKQNQHKLYATKIFRNGGLILFDLGSMGKRVIVVGQIPEVTAQKIAQSVMLLPPANELEKSEASPQVLQR